MVELFVCDNCNCVECKDLAPKPLNGQMLCTLCHPSTKKWHNEFPREIYYSTSNTIVCNRPSGLSFG